MFKNIFLVLFSCVFIPTCWAGSKNPNGIWNTFQGNASHTGYAPLQLDASKFSIRWEKQLLNFDYQPTFSVTGNHLLYAFSQGSLVAVSESSGEIVWRKDFEDCLGSSAPSFVDGKVLIQLKYYKPEQDMHVINAYDSLTGEDLYDFTIKNGLGESSSQTPTPYGDDFFIYTGDAKLASHKMTDGSHNWDFSLPMYGVGVAPAIGMGYVFVYDDTDFEDYLKVYDIVSGEIKFKISGVNYSTSLGYKNDYTSVVLDVENKLAFRINQASLIAFDLDDQSKRYVIESGSVGEPAVANGQLYVTRNGNLQVYDELTGAFLWQWTIDHDVLPRVPFIVTDNYVFIATESMTYAIDISTHKLAWQFPAGCRLSISEDTLYIIETSGMVHAINLTGRKISDPLVS